MRQTFHSRFGLIAALLGMAVGTGNIWRFPRIMAANGGGAFLIPWVLFLFLWSIPLLVMEFSLGKRMRLGVVGCFHGLSGGKFTWMGGFVVFCTLGIMFYYSVVTGWCLYYFGSSVTGASLNADPQIFWNQFTQSGWKPLIGHVLALSAVVWVILRGVHGGIEFISKTLIPTLFIIMIALALYSLSLEGSQQALRFLFTPDFSKLSDYRVWLEGLTQSAWSTGAGWGIALTYGAYAKDDDPPVLTSFTTGLGNNSISLIAALVVLPTLFSFMTYPEVIVLTKTGNTGLTFIALPKLFAQMPGGQFIAILFFLALFFAAFSSLIAMFELGVRFLQDIGIKRKTGIVITAMLALIIGTPSALKMSVLDNQDWAWGVGLLLSGLFFSVLMRRIGMDIFTKSFLPIDLPIQSKVYKFLIFWLIPIEFFILIAWWFYQAISWDPEAWWHPMKTFSVGTCLFQWGLLILVLLLMNRRMNDRITTSMDPYHD